MKKFSMDERDIIIPVNQAAQVAREKQEREAKLEKERMIQEAIQKAKERQDSPDLLFLMEAKFGPYMSIPICDSLNELLDRVMNCRDYDWHSLNTFLGQTNAGPRKRHPLDQESD